MLNFSIILVHSEIGLGLVTFGLAFLTLGVILIFDKGLLAIGNVSKVKLFGHTINTHLSLSLSLSLSLHIPSLPLPLDSLSRWHILHHRV